MNEERAPTTQLSKAVSRLLDWKLLNDTLRYALDEVGVSRSGTTQHDAGGPESTDHELIEKVFRTLKGEFRRVLQPLRRQIIVTSTLILVSLAITIAGAALMSIKPLSSGIVTVTGVGALLPLTSRAWRLARGQAILELLPSKYEVILRLCKSREQYNEVLTRMMDELTTLENRGQRTGRSSSS